MRAEVTFEAGFLRLAAQGAAMLARERICGFCSRTRPNSPGGKSKYQQNQ